MKRSVPLLSAAGGLALWCGLAAAGWPLLAPIERIFLFGPLVIVPMALHLLTPETRRFQLAALYVVTVLFQPVAAIFVVGAFALKPSLAAGVCTAPWVLLTAVVSLLALGRRVGRETAGELFVAAGCLFLSVGGGWLALSRLGIRPMGFSEEIVLLTAVHFHFAGLAASVFAGLLGRLLETDPWRRIYFPAAAGVVAGIPLLAMGITFSPALEMAAAGLLAISLMTLGALAIRLAARLPASLAARIFLAGAGFSVWASMALALVYAWGEWTGRPTVNILFMAKTHGVLNAFGFCFCGLLAMALISRDTRRMTAPVEGAP